MSETELDRIYGINRMWTTSSCTLALCFLFSIIAFIGCADVPDDLREEADKMSGKCKSIFNAETDFCYDGEVYSRCNGMKYNPTTHVCQGSIASPAKCGGKQYNPLKDGCCDSAIFNLSNANLRCQNNVIETKCGTGWYNAANTNLRCQSNAVEAKCGTNWYNLINQRCIDNVIETKCGNGTSWYDVKNTNLRCRGNIVEARCETGWYNLAIEYCSNGTKKSYGFVTHGDQTYKTVVIGEQTWMAENLNYNATSSLCYGDNTGGDSKNHCDAYGRLYNWATAMNLPPGCNKPSTCASQIQSKHKGICPEGWYIPSFNDWRQLLNYVKYIGDSSVAKYLKAKDGWFNYQNEPEGNGTDDYGFFALPGGYGNGDGIFSFKGVSGYWWQANSIADNISISYNREDNIGGTAFGGDPYLSVRCVLSSNISYDSLAYEGQIYKTVKIGSQIWMAENLNYNVDGSACYDNYKYNCDVYGRLYDWATAMSFNNSCNSSICASQIQSKHRGICPEGWHIPNSEDWNQLFDYINMGNWFWASSSLRATIGWNNCGPSGYGSLYNCNDTYGFAALPGGRGYSDGVFYEAGSDGYWWSASEGNASYAYNRCMSYSDAGAYWYNNNKTGFYSVRCLQD